MKQKGNQITRAILNTEEHESRPLLFAEDLYNKVDLFAACAHLKINYAAFTFYWLANSWNIYSSFAE